MYLHRAQLRLRRHGDVLRKSEVAVHRLLVTEQLAARCLHCTQSQPHGRNAHVNDLEARAQLQREEGGLAEEETAEQARSQERRVERGEREEKPRGGGRRQRRGDRDEPAEECRGRQRDADVVKRLERQYSRGQEEDEDEEESDGEEDEEEDSEEEESEEAHEVVDVDEAEEPARVEEEAATAVAVKVKALTAVGGRWDGWIAKQSKQTGRREGLWYLSNPAAAGKANKESIWAETAFVWDDAAKLRKRIRAATCAMSEVEHLVKRTEELEALETGRRGPSAVWCA